MADQPTDPVAFQSYYVFEDDAEANPVPPGKKFTGKHLISLDDTEPAPERPWSLILGVGAAALIVGVLIGRFLLP
jgi:hypothetical protein